MVELIYLYFFFFCSFFSLFFFFLLVFVAFFFFVQQTLFDLEVCADLSWLSATFVDILQSALAQRLSEKKLPQTVPLTRDHISLVFALNKESAVIFLLRRTTRCGRRYLFDCFALGTNRTVWGVSGNFVTELVFHSASL